MCLVGINLFDLSVNKVINQFMAFLGFFYAYERCIKDCIKDDKNNSCEKKK